MRELQVRPRARRDLREIWQYTNEIWSRARADKYVAEIRTAIEKLRCEPSGGQACDEISPGLRRMTCKRHVIFFRLTADHLTVVRVLHGNMDFAAHLGSDEG